MTLVEAVSSCFRKYRTFSTRAARSEYWKFMLFILLVLIALLVVNSLIFGPELQSRIMVSRDASGKVTQTVQQSYLYTDGRLGDIFLLVVLLPLLAVTWRRMHDTGRPGWHILVPVPLAAAAIALAFALAPSVTLPVDVSAFGPDYDGPTELQFPQVPTWLFLGLWVLGLAAFVLSIIWLARRAQAGPNRYGPNPTEAQG